MENEIGKYQTKDIAMRFFLLVCECKLLVLEQLHGLNETQIK